MDTIREILARYGVPAETVPLHGEDVTPFVEALTACMSRHCAAGVGAFAMSQESTAPAYAAGYERGQKDLMTAREAAEKAPRDVRLDPDTLAWVATQIARGRLGDGDIPQALLAVATRERERAPDLADWVAAACRSRLGAPGLCTASEHELEFLWADGPSATIYLGDHVNDTCATLMVQAPRNLTTPAELRAELDRIAGGGS